MESAEEVSYEKKSVCNSCQIALKLRVITNVCLHKFCWDCAFKYMERTVERKQERRCPVCQKQFKSAVSFPFPSDDQWYDDGFPCNWLRITTAFRKKIYSQNVWVLDFDDVKKSHTEFTPQFYRGNPSEMKRISLWLKREIMVLSEHCGPEASCKDVMQTILTMLNHHSIQSKEFKAAIQAYFERETDHFIHEFFTFACSFCDIHTFDDMAFYSSDSNSMNQLNVYFDYQEKTFGNGTSAAKKDVGSEIGYCYCGQKL